MVSSFKHRPSNGTWFPFPINQPSPAVKPKPQSGSAYIAVSLLTPAPEAARLAPYFEDQACKLAAVNTAAFEGSSTLVRTVLPELVVGPNGERTLIQAAFTTNRPFEWPFLAKRLEQENQVWRNPCSYDAVYRLADRHLLGCVVMTRGRKEEEIWLQAESPNAAAGMRRAEMAAAWRELRDILG